MNFPNMEKNDSTKKLFLDHQSKSLKIFYSSMAKVFELNENSTSFRASRLYFLLLYMILYCQFSSLQWRPGMTVYGWSSYASYWQVLSFSRIDTLIYKLNAQFPAYLLLSSTIYITFAHLLIIFGFALKKKTPPKIICLSAGKLLKLESTFLLIPILTFYSILLSQSINYSQFYENDKKLQLDFIYIVNTCICIILHLFHVIITEYMSVELRHSYSHKIFEAKASCATDIKRVISRVIIIQLYSYFSLDSIAWLHILCCAVCGWLGSMYVIYVPYYNRAPNFITFTKICCEFVTSLSFLIAEYLDSSAFLLLFNIFVVPLIGYLSIEIFEWRFKKLENIEFEKIDNYLILELFLRNELSKSEGNLEVIEKFTRFSTNKTRDLGLIAIWECNYCIYSIKDFRLAYIKLAKVSKTGFSVETSFQEYKCFKYLKDNSFDLLEDLNFLNYIFKLTRAKQADRMIAKLYVQFLTEIVSSDPSILVLENFMSGIYRELKSLKRSYESLCTKYPKGNECRKLWTTFNEDIFEYADPLSISRLKFNQTDKILIKVINYFDESNGIMLVSAEKETSGTILYVNDQFARLVEGSVHTLTGTQLNNFIPIPYSNDHNFLLIDYANRCKTSAVEFPSSLFLLTERGFLVECYLSISCASLSCHTFYLVLTKKITINRQIAIVNEEGLIYDHSENLKFFIKSERAIYRKSFIQEYLTNLDMKSLQASVPHEYKDNLHNFFIIKTIKVIGKSSITILNFVKDEQGLTEFVELEKTEIVEENDLTLFNTIKNNIEKGKVRFDREDPGDENTEYFHILEEKEKEKTKSDSSGIKLDGIVVSMNKGLFYGIKFVKLFKWMMIGIVIFN